MAMKPIPWFGPHLSGREHEKLKSALDSNYINDGPLAREFEGKCAQFIGTQYAVAVTSGTAALALSLMAAGIGHGDEVIVPDLTFAATANAVILAGARPVLCDIEPKRFGIDAQSAKKAISLSTAAIISVDVNGRGVSYPELESLCNSYGLKLICDSAEGFGSIYSGRRLGSFGLAGCFSFSANKTISAGQGGLITTNSESLYIKLKQLKDQGRTFGETSDGLHPAVGFNFKFTDLQAAVALSQFEDINQRLESLFKRNCSYLERLPRKVIGHHFWEEFGEHTQWFDILLDNRGAVKAVFEANAIGYRPFWHPLHTQAPYRADPDRFPVSTDISKRGMWLPSRMDMVSEDYDRICDVLRGAIS